MAENTSVKGSGKGTPVPLARDNKRKPLDITEAMKTTITECKKLIKDGCTKAEGAREAYGTLKSKHERRQIIYVFMNGCSLSKFGAGTYYQNCKSR